MVNQQHTKTINRLKWAASNERGLANKYKSPDDKRWQEHISRALEFEKAAEEAAKTQL